MLRLMDSHPEYMGPAATHLIRIFLINASRYRNLENDEEWERFVTHVVKVFHSNQLYWKTEVSADEILQSGCQRSLSGVVDFIYHNEAGHYGKTGVMIKEIAAYEYIPYFLTHFPGCKFVYLVRDPRDIALSWKNRDWWWNCGEQAGVRHAANIWKRNQEKAIQKYLELRDTERIVLVRYEDLLKDPEYTLNQVCHCLGILYSDQMLKFYNSERSIKDSGKRAVFRNLSKPLMKNNSGKFIKGLSREETQWIEHVCTKEMHLLGYKAFYPPKHDFKQLDAQVAKQETQRIMSYEKKGATEETIKSKERVMLLKGISAQEENSLIRTDEFPFRCYTGGS